MDMLAIMWTAPRRGYLETKSGSITIADLSRIVGEPIAEVKQSLSSLEAEGVFSRDGRGTIYCRRYVREQKHRDNKAEAGRMGAAKRWSGGTHVQGGMAKHGSPTPSPTPSPSSTSTPKKKKRRSFGYTPEFERLWKALPKGSKKNAFEEFKALPDGAPPLDKLIEIIEAQKAYKAMKQRFDEPVAPFKDTERWLKDQRWEDALPEDGGTV